jgi:hypothetical protein
VRGQPLELVAPRGTAGGRSDVHQHG